MAIGAVSSVALADDDSFLRPGSLIISSSTYDRSQGAVASLKVGSVLPNTDTATTTAISDNNYLTVWNNETVDASFGVTSPIRLTAVDPRRSGHALRSGFLRCCQRGKWSPASRRSPSSHCMSRAIGPAHTWCSWVTPAPASARSTLRPRMPSPARTRPIQ